MSEPPVIAVDGVTKHFPVRGGLFAAKAGSIKAVDGVGFDIQPGRTFGLVGESGCGKSTLAMLLVKLLEPTAGRISLDGESISDLKGRALKEFRRRVQLVFQDPYGSLDPRQRMLSALIEPLATLGLAASRADAPPRTGKCLVTPSTAMTGGSLMPADPPDRGGRQRYGSARARSALT